MQQTMREGETETVQGLDLDSFLGDLDTRKKLGTEEVRLEIDPNRELQQHDVLRVMMESDRPVFTVFQIKMRLKSDPSKETVRRRLNELVELEVVKVDDYGGTDLYHISDERSNYAVPGDIRDADVPENVGLMDLVLFREPGLYDWLATTSIFLAIYLVLLGTLIDPLGNPITVEGANQFVESGLVVLIGMILLLPIIIIGEKAREVWNNSVND